MGDTEKKLDGWYAKIQKQLTGKISNFVAFEFFLIAFGALIAMIIATRWPEQLIWAVVGPLVVGIFAYFNRTFATIVFIGLIALFFFL